MTKKRVDIDMLTSKVSQVIADETKECLSRIDDIERLLPRVKKICLLFEKCWSLDSHFFDEMGEITDSELYVTDNISIDSVCVAIDGVLIDGELIDGELITGVRFAYETSIPYTRLYWEEKVKNRMPLSEVRELSRHLLAFIEQFDTLESDFTAYVARQLGEYLIRH